MRIFRKLPLITLMTVLSVLWSGCTPEEQVYQAANMEAAFQLHSRIAMDGAITIDEAYLKLREVSVTGTGPVMNTNLTQTIPADDLPFKLSKPDSNRINFTLPARIYDKMDFHLLPLNDTYELVILERVVEPADPNKDDEPKDGGDNDGNGGNTGGENGGDDDGADDNDDEDDRDDNNEGDDDDEDRDEDDDDDDDRDDNDDGEDDDNDGDEKGEKDDKDNKDKDNKDKDDKDKDDKDKDDKDKGDRDKDDDGRVSEKKIRTVDIDHFFQNARPGLVIAATYLVNGKTLKLIFIADRLQRLSVGARQNDAQHISLKETNTASVVFHPAKWFASVKTSDIESADIQMYQGQPVIFIHRDFNSVLFEALASRLEPSASVTIESPPPAAGM